MTRVWCVRSNQPQLDLIENGFVAIGWDDMGDLAAIPNDQDRMKERVASAYPEAKLGAIPGIAGTLLSFAHRMKPGDVVVSQPNGETTVSLGRLGDYYYDAIAPLHRSRRKVDWLAIRVPRTDFTRAARNELGSIITVFRIKNHADEFLRLIGAPEATMPPAASHDDETLDSVEEAAASEPNADRIEAHTRDFVIETLMTQLEGLEFEHFVAHLLVAMGYRTRVTQASGDGGYDIVAHRDPLGLEPPIIKVQCKRTTSTMGGPDIQKLTGTLAPGGNELGLFVTLGAYSKDAQSIARMRQDLRLINGSELVDLVLRHYEGFGPEYKRLLPMRSLYVVDYGPESTG